MVKKTSRECDRCGCKSNIRQCVGCGDDVCRSCRSFIDIDPWTGVNNDDYPEPICKKCDVKLIPYAHMAERILDDAFEETERLKLEWRESCKKEYVQETHI